MQIDQDLRGTNPQPPYQQNVGVQGVFSAGPPSGVNPPAYQQYPNGSRAGLGSLVMAIFTGLNLLFLFITAGYAVGLFESLDTTSDGASFFVTVIMTVIAGGLGLFCSFLGMRLARLANAPVMVTVNKVLFLAVILLSALVVIGPVFN